jgi:hypothetical protein
MAIWWAEELFREQGSAAAATQNMNAFHHISHFNIYSHLSADEISSV